MKWFCRLGAAAVVAGFGAFMPAHAESLRCSGGFADVGDSRLAVLYKCGEPILRDSYCAPLYRDPFFPGFQDRGFRRGPEFFPAPFLAPGAPCLVVDEWVYDRGPGNLIATVRFMSDRVQSIEYGQAPR